MKLLFKWSGSVLSYSYHNSEYYHDNRSALLSINCDLNARVVCSSPNLCGLVVITDHRDYIEMYDIK